MKRTLTREAVLVRIAAAARRAGSLTALAAQWGLSTAYLSDVLHERRAPGPGILRHFGLRRCSSVTYERIS